MSIDISETLRRFNRKECYWVIQSAFTSKVSSVCPKVWHTLRTTLGGRIDHLDREAAWWSIDYQFDWMYAALKTDTTEFLANEYTTQG